jgi:hypothetical protein
VASTSPAASAAKRVRATRTRATPPPEPVAELEAEPDIDFLPTDGIQDYAALQPAAPRRPRPAPRAAPTPSPPLTALPGAGYEPLPDLPPSPSDYTSSAGAPGSSPWAPSHPGELGAKTLEDGYAFSRMPGEVAVEDWTTSFRGLSAAPFPKEVAEALLKPLQPEDVEMKPGEWLPGMTGLVLTLSHLPSLLLPTQLPFSSWIPSRPHFVAQTASSTSPRSSTAARSTRRSARADGAWRRAARRTLALGSSAASGAWSVLAGELSPGISAPPRPRSHQPRRHRARRAGVL